MLKGESEGTQWAELFIRERLAGAQLLACDVVWAEISTLFSDALTMQKRMNELEITFDPIYAASAFAAGEVFRQYRNNRGPRTHLIPDFLVGAHASLQADALAAADRGYLRTYFSKLNRVTPAGVAGG